MDRLVQLGIVIHRNACARVRRVVWRATWRATWRGWRGVWRGVWCGARRVVWCGVWRGHSAADRAGEGTLLWTGMGFRAFSRVFRCRGGVDTETDAGASECVAAGDMPRVCAVRGAQVCRLSALLFTARSCHVPVLRVTSL